MGRKLLTEIGEKISISPVLALLFLSFFFTLIDPFVVDSGNGIEKILDKKGDVVLAIGPHHLLAEDLVLKPFEVMRNEHQSFDEVILIGPNHFNLGGSDILTAGSEHEFYDRFNFSDFGLVGDSEIGETDIVFKDEHSIYTYLNVIKENFGNAKVTPIVFKWALSEERVDEFTQILAEKISQKASEGKSVLVFFSVDFSHFQTPEVTRLHDVKSRGVIEQRAYNEAYQLEVDCKACIYSMLKLATIFDKHSVDTDGNFVLENKNSFDYLGKNFEEGNTSYFSGVFAGDGVVKSTRSVNMIAFGDMMLDRYIRTLIQRYGLDHILGRIAGPEDRFFNGYDFVFTNLEGPVTPVRRPTGKSIAFQFDPQFLEILKANYFNVVSNANNHTYDMGQNGFTDTLKYLGEAGIPHFGDAKGINEFSTYETVKGGWRFGFLGLNHSDFKLDINDIKAAIADLRTRNDFVVVSIHWGVEYVHVPLDFQRDWAAEMVKSGVDMVIGHHPHVLQGMEFISGRPVFYSLGNFVFDQWFSVETQESVGVGISFNSPAVDGEPNEANAPKIDLTFVPIQIEMGVPFQPKSVKGAEILNKFYDYSFATNPLIESKKALFELGY